MGQTYIADVADVVFRRKRDGHVVFTAEAQLAGISGAEESEGVRGGIGNQLLYTIRHSKETTLTVRNATFDLEYLSMIHGVSIEENGKAQVTVVERDLIVQGGKVSIKDTPVDNKVRYKNKENKFVDGTVSGKEVTVQGFNDGEKVTVEYKKEVTGRKIILDASKFSETYEVEYRTIEYDVETETHIKDIYFLFYNASPAGEYEINLEAGTAFTPELSFNVKTDPVTKKVGEVIEVDIREEQNESGGDESGGGESTP